MLGQAQGLLEKSKDPKLVLQLLSLLEPLDKRLSRLASAANIHGGEKVDEDQHVLLDLHWNFSKLIAGLGDLRRAAHGRDAVEFPGAQAHERRTSGDCRQP